MGDTNPPDKVEATAAKKTDAEGEGDAVKRMAEALADAYKKGFADALTEVAKFRAAESEPEKKDKKVEASAKAEPPKTDQALQSAATTAQPSALDFLMKIVAPTRTVEPHMRELFKAAAEHPTAPADIRARLAKRFE